MNQRWIRCLGLSYKTAPLQFRERLRCSLSDLWGLRLGSDAEFRGFRELAWLQTCNRVELYVRVESGTVGAERAMQRLLARATGVDRSLIAAHCDYKRGEEAVVHLCRVAAGLESALLGENQILGQVVSSLQTSTTLGCLEKDGLGGAFEIAVEVGRKARSQTGINRKPASLGSAAIDWARTRLGSLQDRRLLVVGLGEMGSLAVKALRARNFRHLTLMNRTASRARALAVRSGCDWLPVKALPEALVQADLVILATSAPRPILSRDLVGSVVKERPRRPLALVDLGVPRNVESEAGNLQGVSLCDSDRLQLRLAGALEARRREIPRVEEMIEDMMRRARDGHSSSGESSCLLDLRRSVEDIRQSELERLFRHLGPVEAGMDDHIRRFSQALVNKILHQPTLRIKQESRTYEGPVRELFGLSAGQENGVT